MARLSLALGALALLLGCNSGLSAPSKQGPAPDYEEPGLGADDAGPPLNEKFGDEASALFQGAGGEALKSCQAQAQAQGRFQGTVQVHVVLKPDGALVTAEPRNDSGLPAPLVECLTRTLAGLHFPAPGGSRNLAFDVPLRFVDAAELAEPDAGAEPAADAGAGKTKPKAKPKKP